KILDRTTLDFCELFYGRTMTLIAEISNLTDKPEEYDAAVRMAKNEVNDAFRKLPGEAKHTIEKYFCMRKTPVDRSQYITQIV
ncbi:hypothetical protein PFISCL1PPCAC_13460, partial [Pristionchus fissidentatus]